MIRSPASPGAAIARRAAWAFSTNLPTRITSSRPRQLSGRLGDGSALTLATKSKLRLECIPSCSLDFVSSRKQQPGEEPRKVLDGTVELHSTGSASETDQRWMRSYLVSPHGDTEDFQRLRSHRVENDLRRDTRHCLRTDWNDGVRDVGKKGGEGYVCGDPTGLYGGV